MDTIIRDIAVFDLGGVLIEWDPRHLYRRLFNGDEEAMENFLATVCTPEWNRCQDAGRSFAEAEAEAIARHPDKRALITAWWEHFDEMAPGAIEGTVAVLARLRARGVPLYALSNWSAETFPMTRPLFPFLDEMDGILISGEVGVGKPDPAIFREFIARFGIVPAETVYIDDWDLNIATAVGLGLVAIQFIDAAQLRADLRRLGVIVAPVLPA
jgi:2-haloacid dehalogenase